MTQKNAPAFSRSLVQGLIDEHGHADLFEHVSKAFIAETGVPAQDVVDILWKQCKIVSSMLSGEGKHERAKACTCLFLASGWECAGKITHRASSLLSSHNIATAYAILVWRETHPTGGAA